ncbi:MAG: tetratricopeptide repeat protein [Armatimonadota bacterium]
MSRKRRAIIHTIRCNRMSPVGVWARAVLAVTALCILATLCGCRATNAWMQADNLYKAKKFEEAAQTYADAAKHTPQRRELVFNRGVSQFMAEDFDGALQSFQKTARDGSSELKEKAEFNTGNTYVAQENTEKALEHYRRTLYLNSDNMRAKWNLEMLQRQEQQQQQKQQPPQKDQENKEDEQKQQKDESKDQQQQEKQKQEQEEEQGQHEQQSDKDRRAQQETEEARSERPKELSKEQAERLLQALAEEDKELQKSLRKPEYRVKPPPGDKDW